MSRRLKNPTLIELSPDDLAIRMTSTKFSKNGRFQFLGYLSPADPRNEVGPSGQRYCLIRCACCGRVFLGYAPSFFGAWQKNTRCPFISAKKKPTAIQSLRHRYESMIARCTDPSHPRFRSYGLRGVKVCAEWLPQNDGWQNFKNWALNHGYAEELELDKDGICGGMLYSPSTCRWISQSENLRAPKKKSSRQYVKLSNDRQLVLCFV